MISFIGKKTSSALVALLTAFTVMTGSTSAQASTPTTGTVTGIRVQPNFTLVNLSDGHQYVIATTGPCSPVSIDQSKVMVSLIQSALLSGKQINVLYDTCSGQNYFTTVDLIP
jgi:hypothetical protein